MTVLLLQLLAYLTVKRTINQLDIYILNIHFRLKYKIAYICDIFLPDGCGETQHLLGHGHVYQRPDQEVALRIARLERLLYPTHPNLVGQSLFADHVS